MCKMLGSARQEGTRKLSPDDKAERRRPSACERGEERRSERERERERERGEERKAEREGEAAT